MQSSVIICGLLLVIIPVHAHVSKDFEECREFFFGNVWQEWPASRYHKEICQTYENNWKMPPDDITWRNLQFRLCHLVALTMKFLVDQKLDKNMMRSDDLVKKAKNPKVKLADIEKVQAVHDDYRDTDHYNRGHLNPRGHHTGLSRKATFTLTNVVPQSQTLNNGEWGNYEKTVTAIFKNCYKAYVLVGAIPSTNPESWIKRDNKKRVNIPDYLWHAYCCTDEHGSPIKSGAATAKNTENRVQQCSLKSLEQFFGKLNKRVELFKNCNAPEKEEPTGDCSSVIE